MKRTLPLIISFVVGIFMLAEYFVPSWHYRVAYTYLREWGIVLVAGASILFGEEEHSWRPSRASWALAGFA